MEDTLLNYIREFNSKIKNGKNIKWEKTISHPILQYLENNNLITTELEKILNETPCIKKLRFYKFSDHLKVSDSIEIYLSKSIKQLLDIVNEDFERTCL